MRRKCRKNSAEEFYQLDILLDINNDPTGDAAELYYQRPSVMEASGWKVLQEWVKDWLHNSDDVRKKILGSLE
jgi:hypothetical protein